MTLIIVLIAISIIYLIVAFISDFPKWLAIFPFFLAIVKWIYDDQKSKKSSKSIINLENSYRSIIEEQNKELGLSQEKLSELENKRGKIEKVLLNVNEKLNQENISKEDLIKDLKDDLEIVLVVKHVEGYKGQQEPKYLNNVLKKLGFKHIGYYGSLWILSPSLSPKIKSTIDLEKWVNNKILKKIPQGYRNKISIMLVDLKKVLVKSEGETRMRSIFEKIDITDIVKLTYLDDYLRKKKNISLLDIIQIPRIDRLVKKESLGRGDANKIINKSELIIKDIKIHLGLQEIKTKDFANIDKNILVDILNKYGIKNKDQVAEDIIENSKFWRQF